MRLVSGVRGAAAIALGAAMAVLSLQALPPTTALVSCLLGWLMLAIAAIDARHFVIPDVLSLPAAVLGLLASGSLLDPSRAQIVSQDHVTGAIVGGGAFWLVRGVYGRWRGREGLGLGDVKLAAAAGAWVGWDSLAEVVLLAAAAALSFAIVEAVVHRRSLSGGERVAFGVFLAPSIWVVWWLRQVIGGPWG